MTTNIRVVTTCHRQGFEDYGKRCLESWGNWPKNAELWWYTEDYELPETERVVQVPNTKIQSLQSFKLKFDYYLSPRYLFDVVRFSNKVYAAIDALSDFNGIGVTPVGLEDVSHFPSLTLALLEHGYTPADVRKILGGNFMRVFSAVCQ